MNSLFWVLVSRSRRGVRKGSVCFHSWRPNLWQTFFSLHTFGNCRISKAFHKIETTLLGKFLDKKWTVGGYRGGDYVLPLNVSCNQHLLTLTWGFMTHQILDMQCFSLKSIYCVFWHSPLSQDIVMTVFLLSTEKLEENPIALLLIWNSHMFTFRNNKWWHKNAKQAAETVLFNVFHMWRELLFSPENYAHL